MALAMAMQSSALRIHTTCKQHKNITERHMILHTNAANS